MTLMIADAQVHIWAANTPERPWPERQHAHREVPISKDDMIAEMDAAGVHRCVLVPPSWEGDRNDLSLEAARLHPDRFAVMGRLDLDAPDARDQLAGWRDHPGLLGWRFSFAKPALWGPFLAGTIDWVWETAEKSGAALMISAGPANLHLVERIVTRHPALKVVIDHLALENGKKDDAAFAGLDKLLALAKYPNVAVKATSLPSYTTDSYPYRWLHPHLKRVHGAFGAQRMFWGSDFSRLPCSYRQCVTMFTEEMPWLSAQDLEWIMGRGLCEWLGWPIGAVKPK